MCPYAQKVWLALEAGNCPYEMQQIDLYGGGGKPEWFLDLNPAGEVPVVTCFGGAKILIDSEYILTRLAEGLVEGGQALGGDGSEEMNDRMDQWRDVIDTEVKKVGKQAVLRGGKHVNELMELLKSLDGNVVGPYLCGDAVTVADCSAFPFLWRLDSEFGPLTKDNGCGNIRAWLDTCGETEAFKKTIQSAWWWWW
jgi:glutathione S-transferase